MTVSGGAAAARPSPGDPGGPAADAALMSIGEVLANLRPDFPDTTISKLRFLETEGLVDPRRTPAGYRKYSWADVARLRYILAAQRDQYLPLRVIREQLAGLGRGEVPGAARATLIAVSPVTPGVDSGVGEDPGLDRADLLARAGVDAELLADLEQHGLVAADRHGRYPADAVDVLAAADALAAFGVEGRHLRAYRAAADREVGLFNQLVAPVARGGGPAARDRAEETVRELAAATQRLHAALVRIGLAGALRR